MSTPSSDPAPLDYFPSPGRVPGPIGRFLISPLGATWNVAAVLVVLWAWWAWSGPAPYLYPALYAVYGTIGLVLICLARQAAGQTAARRFGVRLHWPVMPRLVLPTVLATTAALVYFDIPPAVTFRLSRPAMERTARAILANPTAPVTPVHIGLYGRCVPQIIGTSVYFKVGGGGIGGENYGYAYRPSGPPHLPLRPSYLHDDAYCRQVDGAWYEWCGGY